MIVCSDADWVRMVDGGSPLVTVLKSSVGGIGEFLIQNRQWIVGYEGEFRLAGSQWPTSVVKNPGTFVSKDSGSPLKGCLKKIDRAWSARRWCRLCSLP